MICNANVILLHRYVYTTVWGRSDYAWQGTSSWVPHGFSSPPFVEFIGSLAPSLRPLFHFPAVGHEFYSATSLRALEERYPGWDRTGEYQLAGGVSTKERSGNPKL